MTVAEPMVVVDDLHIVYRVYGAGGSKGTAATALMRVLRRQNRPVCGKRTPFAAFLSWPTAATQSGSSGGTARANRRCCGRSRACSPGARRVYTTGEASLLGVNAALLDDLTGERNVVLGCLAMGMSPQEVKSRYSDIVEFSGVGDSIDLPMRTYSSGMGRGCASRSPRPRATMYCSSTRHWPPATRLSGAKSHERDSRNSDRRRARCSWWPTTSARWGPATG